jgi:hypothetical protein
MSVARVETVKKSRKDQGKCGKCGTELPAGSAYLYFYVGFRSNYKQVRCLRAECFPRPSERESSLASSLLAAQESFHDQVATADSPEDIEALVQEVADAIDELKGEYETALESWENGNEQLQEKVDHYEDQHSELSSWSWDGNTDYDLCSEHEGREDNVPEEEIQECGACQEKREEWLEECRDAAREVVDAVETL